MNPFSYDVLAKVLRLDEKIDGLLILDTINQSGWSTLSWICYNAFKRDQPVIIVSFDSYPDTILSASPFKEHGNKVKFIDLIDYENVVIDNPKSIKVQSGRIIENIKSCSQQFGTHKLEPLVIFDSVNNLLDLCETDIIGYRLLTSVINFTQGNTILLYHKDGSNPLSLESKKLQYLCSTHLQVSSFHLTLDKDTMFLDDEHLDLDLHSNFPDGNLLTLTHKLTSGKVAYEEARMEITTNENGFMSVKFSQYIDPTLDPIDDVTGAPSNADKPSAQENKDPTGIPGLSFNLSLTDSQKATRSEVQLPYLATSMESIESNMQSKLGTIHYHPDDGDDFDEDDPDDDLEI